MSQSEQNRAMLEKIYALFFAGEIDKMTEYLSDDAVITEVQSLPYPGQYFGKDGLRTIVGKLMETWDDLAFEMDDILASDSRAAGIGTFSATSRATGRRVSFPMCEVWEFVDGKIVSCMPIYGDTAQVRQATGMAPI